MNDEAKAAIQRAIDYGIDISLLEASLKLTPTERVRKGEAFARFAWEVREQGRLHREKQAQHASDAVRDDTEPPAQ